MVNVQQLYQLFQGVIVTVTTIGGNTFRGTVADFNPVQNTLSIIDANTFATIYIVANAIAAIQPS